MRAYYIYVVELADEPDRTRARSRLPDVYVGSSALTPAARLQKHRTSARGSRHVRERGVRLLPKLYQEVNPLPTRQDARREEQKLHDRLKRSGYRVYGSCSSKDPDCWL